MGQYYQMVVKEPNTDKLIKIPNRGYKSDSFMGLKLTEHSWIGNEWMDLLSLLVYKRPLQVIQIGDYVEPTELEEVDDELKVFTDSNADINELDITEMYKQLDTDTFAFDYKDKYLCNHIHKCYLNLNEYMEKSHEGEQEDCLHPLGLLVALGNGRGGGDYAGVNENDVGSWAWDIISIEDEIPEGYTEEEYTFVEK